MRKLKILVIVLLMAGTANNVCAIDLTQWKYRAAVTFEGNVNEYCKLKLTPEIYDAASTTLDDIRLVDEDGEQIPYVLIKNEDSTNEYECRPRIINRATNDAKMSFVTLDFAKKTVKNSLEVVTAGSNFRRAVKVEGSNDNVEFFTLAEGAFIFAVGDEEDSRFSKVDLPMNDYRYLRITVEPMTTEDESPVIKEVKAFKIEKKVGRRELVEMPVVEQTEDAESNSSIYVYDLANKHLPISEIELDIVDESFYRYVTLYGRDSATRKVKLDSEDNRARFREVEVRWQRIMSGTIYRFTNADGEKCEKLVLRIRPGGRVYRYLKLAIKNYDDRPVVIKSVWAKMITHELVFAAKETGAVLYAGSELAKKPLYDLRHRLREPEQVKATVATLGPIMDNPLFGQTEDKDIPWTERHKGLLAIIMAAIVLGVGGFILKSLKSTQSEQE